MTKKDSLSPLSPNLSHEIELGPFTEIIINFTLTFSAALILIVILAYIRILKRRVFKKGKDDIIREAHEFINHGKWSRGPSQAHILALKNILLERIDLQNDKSKLYFETYKQFGLIDRDLNSLQARIWWNKIDALLSFDVYFSYLDSGRQKKVLQKIRKLSFHKKTIIRTSANLVLSNNLDSGEIVIFLERLEQDAKRGEQLYQDIIENLFRRFPMKIIHYVEQNPETNLSRVAIKVIGRSGQKKISHHLGELLKKHKFHSLDNLKTLIKAIGDLKASNYMNVIDKYIPHEDDEVEIAALLSLFKLDPQRFDIGYLEFLKKDPRASHDRIGEVISYISSQSENLEDKNV